jgi:hypothetical protein
MTMSVLHALSKPKSDSMKIFRTPFCILHSAFCISACLCIAASAFAACTGRVILLDKKTDAAEYMVERTLDREAPTQARTDGERYAVGYTGHNISILDIYKFAWRSAATDFIIPDELLHIISQINPGYNVAFSSSNTPEGFEAFRADLDSLFKLKTDLLCLDATVLLVSKIEETGKVKVRDSIHELHSTVSRTNSQISLQGLFRIENISDYINEIAGLPVKIDSVLENSDKNYAIDSLSIPKGLSLDDLIAWLKANGIYVEKQKGKVNFIKISNLYSDDSVFRYAPEQLENDAHVFFRFVEENHPNPYFRYGKEAFEQKERQIFEQLQEGRTREEFIGIMNLINPHLDPHTQFVDNYISIQVGKGIALAKEKGEKIFPDVACKDGRIFSVIDHQEVEILSINGHKTKEMLDSIKCYWVEWAPNLEKLLMEYAFPLLLPAFFDVHAPFTAGLPSGTKVIGGIPLADASGYKAYLEAEKRRKNPVSFTVYPQSSAAVLYVHTFEENAIHPDSLDMTMKMLNDSLKRCNVKNLFIDVSKNSGGSVDVATKFFGYFRHDTLFCRHRWSGKLPENATEMFRNNVVSYPQQDKSLFDGNIFVLQGTRTYSCGDVFCRVMAENRLGIRFGQETSQHGKCYLPAQIQGLVYVNLSFSYAFGFWAFESFDDNLLQPDMQWNVDNTSEFSEKELGAMLQSYQESTRQESTLQ